MKTKNCIAVILIMIINGISVLMAQAPPLINYQAIARDSNTGVELSNQPIYISLKILAGGPAGEIFYQEDHPNVETNALGLFNLSIGGGQAITGNFENINWSQNNFWLQIDIDAGNGLETMGSMQFLSVPYAFHAETATYTDDADSDPENELVTAIEFNAENNIFSLIQPGSVLTQDLSALINDADSDPQNELVTAIEFNSDNKIFSLIQPGSVLSQDLSALIDDADSDPTNELVSAIQFNPSTKIFSLVQEGSTLTEDLSALVNDADSDPTNELVSAIQFNPATSIFSLVQEGSTLTQDLSALINDADSDPLNEAITNVSLSGTDLIINEVSNFTVSLSQLVNDADADPENEKINLLELINDTIFRIHEGEEVYEIDFGILKRNMEWRSSDDGQTISNYGSRVGIGTVNPASTLQINGSVGYKTRIVSNLLGAQTIGVLETDNIIICTMVGSSANSLTLNMPPAISCPGRSITVRKTGGLPIVAPVTVSFGSDLLDFANENYSMNSFQRETATFISMGIVGWTIIYSE